mgnify:CR=1 FL=1
MCIRDSLLTNVKNKDPYFRLPDGTYYIIPDEMMAKLSDLVLFGKDHGNTLKIHKSQRALIEALQKGNEHDISVGEPLAEVQYIPCLLYTSDAADERSSVDLGGRRIIKKKKRRELKMLQQDKTPVKKVDKIAEERITDESNTKK